MSQARCPHCKKEIEWKDNPYRPFCSERCKLVDFGKWVSEEYRVKGGPVDISDGTVVPFPEKKDE